MAKVEANKAQESSQLHPSNHIYQDLVVNKETKGRPKISARLFVQNSREEHDSLSFSNNGKYECLSILVHLTVHETCMAPLAITIPTNLTQSILQ